MTITKTKYNNIVDRFFIIEMNPKMSSQQVQLVVSLIILIYFNINSRFAVFHYILLKIFMFKKMDSTINEFLFQFQFSIISYCFRVFTR